MSGEIRKLIQDDVLDLPLTVVEYKGRQAMLLPELEAIAGWSQGYGSTKLKKEGEDGFTHLILRGEEAKLLREVYRQDSVNLGGRPVVTLVFREGFYLVALGSNTEQGIALRRKAAEIFARLDRGETVSKEKLTGKYRAMWERTQLDREKEERLRLAEERRFAKLKLEMLKDLEQYECFRKEDIASLKAGLYGEATGQNIEHMKPALTERWMKAGEVGKRLGVSGNKVGRLANELGLKGDDRYSRQVMDKSPYNDTMHPNWTYNEAAVERLAGALRG